MAATVRDMSPDEVRLFRNKHGLQTQQALDTLLGLGTHKGRSTRRWESDGAPPYIRIILSYADRFGLTLLKKVVAANEGKLSAEEVYNFRKKIGIASQARLDTLMGFVSEGRATRLWESNGAPAYLRIIFAYAEKYGLGVMEELVADREARKRREEEERAARRAQKAAA